VSPASRAYCDTISAWPLMIDWIAEAAAEPQEMEELDVEF
jgi:glutathione S-transferase